jgi:hypothetical protein
LTVIARDNFFTVFIHRSTCISTAFLARGGATMTTIVKTIAVVAVIVLLATSVMATGVMATDQFVSAIDHFLTTTLLLVGMVPGSFSIAEWCRHRRVSVSFFYKMRAEGWGPKTMAVGSRETISAEADAQWCRERETAAALGIRRALPENSGTAI